MNKNNKKNIRKWLVVSSLALILAAGSFLRIYSLGSESLALDEFHSLETSAESLGSIIIGRPLVTNPPLYFVCLRIWVELFGNSDTALRSLSVVFGILSILAVYMLGYTLFDKKTALLSSFLSAFSLYYIEYSQEARPYPLFLLLSLLSMTAFVNVLKKGRKQDYIFGIVTNILMVYSHNYGLFIVAAQVLFLIVHFKTYRTKMKNLVLMFGATGILSLPLFLFLYSGSNRIDSILAWIKKPSFKSIFDLAVTFSGKSLVLTFIFLSLILSVFIRIDLRRIYALFVKKKYEKISVSSSNQPIYLNLIILWLLTPIALSLIFSWTIIPIFSDRYFIGCSGAFYLLTARGLSRLHEKRFLFPVLLIILISAYSPIKDSLTKYDKIPWKEITSFIGQRYQESDIIFLQPGYIQVAFERYYPFPADFRRIHRGFESESKMQIFMQRNLGKKERIWLVKRHEPFPFFMDSYLLRLYGEESLVLQKEFPGGMIYLFDIKNKDADRLNP